jgi:hypothetical protein
MRIATSFMAGTCTALALLAQPVSAAPAGSNADFWFGIGGGAYTGEDYDPPPNPQPDDDYDAGGYAMHMSLNAAGPALFRIRSSWYEGYTSNTAEEVAATIGVPLSPSREFWLAAGVSRLTDVSNEKQSPTVGVPIELLFYPVRGLELMIHGNFNDDSNFVGIAVGGAIGHRRPR